MTRPLVDQVANLASAHVAAVEVLGRLGAASEDLWITADANGGELLIQLTRGGMVAAHDLLADLDIEPMNRSSGFVGNAVVYTWRGVVADFPVVVTVTIWGGRQGTLLAERMGEATR